MLILIFLFFGQVLLIQINCKITTSTVIRSVQVQTSRDKYTQKTKDLTLGQKTDERKRYSQQVKHAISDNYSQQFKNEDGLFDPFIKIMNFEDAQNLEVKFKGLKNLLLKKAEADYLAEQQFKNHPTSKQNKELDLNLIDSPLEDSNDAPETVNKDSLDEQAQENKLGPDQISSTEEDQLDDDQDNKDKDNDLNQTEGQVKRRLVQRQFSRSLFSKFKTTKTRTQLIPTERRLTIIDEILNDSGDGLSFFRKKNRIKYFEVHFECTYDSLEINPDMNTVAADYRAETVLFCSTKYTKGLMVVFADIVGSEKKFYPFEKSQFIESQVTGNFKMTISDPKNFPKIFSNENECKVQILAVNFIFQVMELLGLLFLLNF